MYKKFSQFLSDLRSQTSGNAVMMVAMGMPALIGAAGLAVDMSQWYVWKRELQHSVDQAALAGAFALTNENSEDNYADRARQDFAANQVITAGFDTTPTVSLGDYAGGDDNSVIVTASASKALPFSSFLTGNAITVSVSAQASFAQGGNYSACIVTHTTGSFGGNSTVTAPCGIGSLYCPNEGDADEDTPVITIDGSATVTTNVIVACNKAEVDVPAGLEDKVRRAQLSDAYANLAPPTNNTAKTYECSKGKNKQASPTPGTYKGLTVGCTTVFAPGIYVIDGGELDLAANYNVTGNGVMFVLKGGARLKLGGNGNGNSINLTPMQASQFTGTAYASLANKYAGILVFEDRNNQAINPGHKINGNSDSIVEGVIYLPANELEVMGTANVSSECLVLSSKSLRVLGNANLTTMCPSTTGGASGSSTGMVRLVA